MHPDFLRELGAQRGSDMRARAERVRLGRLARRSRRHAPAEDFVVPTIPDYVDGSFLTEQVPAARHAA
jgi:hypothetical protein